MSVYTGKVVWFNKMMGFGFLTCKALGDIFVPGAAIETADSVLLCDGEDVEFEAKPGADGKPQAVRVRRLLSTA